MLRFGWEELEFFAEAVSEVFIFVVSRVFAEGEMMFCGVFIEGGFCDDGFFGEFGRFLEFEEFFSRGLGEEFWGEEGVLNGMVAEGKEAVIRGAAEEIYGDGFEEVVGVVGGVDFGVMSFSEGF